VGTKGPNVEANNSDTGTGAPGSFSSPACYLHEFQGSGVGATLKSWDDIRAWRKQTREALIASRMALGAPGPSPQLRVAHFVLGLGLPRRDCPASFQALLPRALSTNQ